MNAVTEGPPAVHGLAFLIAVAAAGGGAAERGFAEVLDSLRQH